MPKTPSYRTRAGYSQAIVTLTDKPTGKRRDYWLGEHGSPASREAYHRLIAEWEAAGRAFPERLHSAAGGAGPLRASPLRASPHEGAGRNPLVIEIIRAYWAFAKTYYRPNEYGTLRVSLRMLKQFYGRSPAEEFGPKKLRLLRDAMIRGDSLSTPPRRPWSRVYCNQQTRRIRQMFRWAASRELISASVHQSLATIETLKRGRCGAREGKRVLPVSRETVEAVRPYLNRQVAALVDLQLLTGARCGELLPMRANDIDTDGPNGVWTYRPREHKNQFRGQDRLIYLGPVAQAAILPFLAGRAGDSFLFSPAEAEEERRARRTADRKTPLCCGNRVGTNRRRKPDRQPGDRYTTPSYYRAIQRACDLAFPPPAELMDRIPKLESALKAAADHSTTANRQARADLAAARAEVNAWRKAHRWHPHQLRHTAGTDIRRQFGLEAAQLVLGHSSAQITDAIYAERDAGRTVEIMKRVG